MAATVYDYFQQALRRPPSTVVAGPTVRDAEDNLAVFHVTLKNGRIAGATFRATTCVTLLALCEHLCQIAPGLTTAEAEALNSTSLLALHPEIPPARRNRAELAVRAFHQALKGIQ
ncbi:MAG: hypothetical protein ABI693_19740 [Bryobacteraceae bacterium]